MKETKITKRKGEWIWAIDEVKDKYLWIIVIVGGIISSVLLK